MWENVLSPFFRICSSFSPSLSSLLSLSLSITLFISLFSLLLCFSFLSFSLTLCIISPPLDADTILSQFKTSLVFDKSKKQTKVNSPLVFFHSLFHPSETPLNLFCVKACYPPPPLSTYITSKRKTKRIFFKLFTPTKNGHLGISQKCFSKSIYSLKICRMVYSLEIFYDSSSIIIPCKLEHSTL